MKVRTINLRTLLPSLLLPIIVGAAGAIVTASGMEAYKLLNKPPLVPPGWVFSVVWTVLYIIMGYSAYLVKSSKCYDKQSAMQVYYIQLALNFIWVLVFFRFGLLWLSAIILLLLTAAVIFTMLRFLECDTFAGRLLIPYVIWCLFALYLNVATAIIN